ncbi:VOC family protein [Oculatella sp. LEGE 06141]|uniref:VOC family protein n=1 Tax=Oculatella sp. LEGE 06141 TaxID=1828648 RepID=UPI00188298EF|nr:VOC family protein [Oculatella sp. LEGE 06141]MBE9179753.1 VOC family protein [Oculatella sp. LEGE 06141]
MKVTQSLHTALLVSNLEQAEHFYGTVLGLPKVDRVLKFPGAWYQLGSYQLHLIVDSAYSTQIQNQQKWGRNPHIAFAVDDLEQAKAQLTTHGCDIQLSASGRPALFTRDPDGNIVELSQT